MGEEVARVDTRGVNAEIADGIVMFSIPSTSITRLKLEGFAESEVAIDVVSWGESMLNLTRESLVTVVNSLLAGWGRWALAFSISSTSWWMSVVSMGPDL